MSSSQTSPFPALPKEKPRESWCSKHCYAKAWAEENLDLYGNSIDPDWPLHIVLKAEFRKAKSWCHADYQWKCLRLYLIYKSLRKTVIWPGTNLKCTYIKCFFVKLQSLSCVWAHRKDLLRAGASESSESPEGENSALRRQIFSASA